MPMSLSRSSRVVRTLTALAFVVVMLNTSVQPVLAEPSLRDRQWYIDTLRIPDAQRVATGSGVLVAVVDSGVDALHPDLDGQVIKGVDLVGGSVDGWTDTDGHGTHMAGLIAAKGRKVLGIAPGVRILPVRVLIGDARKPTDQSIALGIEAAVDHGATVINLSLGSPGWPSLRETRAIQYAYDHDAVVVASSGNTDTATSVVAPANVPGVVAVTGTNSQGQFSPTSVSGPSAVIAAPSDQIANVNSRSAPHSTGYSLGTGTSDSAAIVSGVVALIRARYPRLDAANVINRLIRTADDAGPPGRDPQYGFGRVNVLNALTADVPPVTANPLGDPAASADATGGASAVSTAPTAVADADGGGGVPHLLQRLVRTGVLLLCLAAVLGVILFVARRIRRRSGRSTPPGDPSGSTGRPPAASWPAPPAGPVDPVARPPGTGSPPAPPQESR